MKASRIRAAAFIGSLVALAHPNAQAATVTGGETVLTFTAEQALADRGVIVGPLGDAAVVGSSPLPTLALPVTGGRIGEADGTGSVEHLGSGIEFISTVVPFTIRFEDIVIDTVIGEVAAEATARFLDTDAISDLADWVAFEVTEADVQTALTLTLTNLGASLLSEFLGADFSDLAGTEIATANIEIEGLAPVPLPSALWLMGSALAGLSALQVRRRRRQGHRVSLGGAAA